MPNHIFPIPEPADSPFWCPEYDVDPYEVALDPELLLEIAYPGQLFDQDPEA